MPPNRGILNKKGQSLLPETCGGHSREGVNVLRSYLLPISAGITRSHKVLARHCPCALDQDQERQSDRKDSNLHGTLVDPFNGSCGRGDLIGSLT